MRFLMQTALAGLLASLLLLTGQIMDLGPFGASQWSIAFVRAVLFLAMVPALASLHARTLEAAGHKMASNKQQVAGLLWLVGGILHVAGMLLQPSGVFAILAMLGIVILAGGSIFWSIQVFKHAPKQSLVRAEDPLTKGDDACFKHIVFAHRFLAVSALFWIVSVAPGLGSTVWAPRFWWAGAHLLLIGFGALSTYGIGHYWIPRFSGVPAIAAGAIKGELHTSLLGIVGITVAFLIGHQVGIGRGLMLGLGPFVFLGTFVYMGVLGANIMKNKSKTQRVTPEFVYIPWTFSGVFWLISGVLMGVFLNVVPDAYADRFADLRFIHWHMAILGGIVQLWLSWLIRILAADAGQAPPRFSGPGRWGFFAYNLGIGLLILAPFTPSVAVWAVLLVFVGIVGWQQSTRTFMSAAKVAAA